MGLALYVKARVAAVAAKAQAHAAELVTPAARPAALYTAALVHVVLGDCDRAARHRWPDGSTLGELFAD
jgi:hypothetical protein